jgi:tetratricopeptide (TPR) repeat protein
LVGDQVEVMELADDAILVETMDEDLAVEGEAAYPQGAEDADAAPIGSDTSEGELQPAEGMAEAGDMTAEGDIAPMDAGAPLETAAEDGGAPVLELGHGGEEESENEATQAYDREALLAEAAKLSAPTARAEGSRGRAHAAAPRAVSESAEAAEIEEPEEFAEAEFFIEQQLWDEAEEALGALRSRIHEFPHMEERLASFEQRLEAGRNGGDVAASTAEEADSEGPFDLAAEIEKEVSKVGPAPTNEVEQSFEEVVEELQHEADETVRPEDVETHYDLGIAYREMGLLDEAIGEFELAAKGASGQPREADCLAMVGDCLNGKGNVAEAAAVFERAGNIDGLSPETSLNLYFEIGVARERLADAAGALEAFERVASIDSTYRDVAEKLAKLKGSQRKMGYL